MLNKFLFIVGLSLGFEAEAQTMLRLDEAIRIALEQRHQLRIAKNDAAIAANNVTRANAGMTPEINAVAALGYGNQNARLNLANGEVIERNFANSGNGTAGVQLTWTLYDGRRMSHVFDRLDATRVLAEESLQAQIEQTITEVMLAWTQVQVQQTLLNYLNTNASYFDERLRLAKARKEAGSTGKSQVLQAQLDKNAHTSTVLQAENLLIQHKAALHLAMGQTTGTNFSVPPPDTVLIAYNLPELIQQAEAVNPQIRLARQQQALAAIAISEAESFNKPRIGLNASYLVNNARTEAGIVASNFNYGLNTGLSLSWNLYDGGNTRRQVANAKIAQQSAKEQMDQIRQEIAHNLTTAYQAREQWLRLVRLEMENVKLAREALDLAQTRFKIESGEILPVREAQKTFEDAQQRLINAHASLKMEEIRIAALVGVKR
jgi:outer membrane protein